jgi:dTDP-4-amino-4,6-dideoxygalactose transaminase
MSDHKIWLSSPHMGGYERDYINDAFDSNWIAPFGANITGFEHDLEKYLSHDSFVTALNSATAAIQLLRFI